MKRIRLFNGDITILQVDAIVNAANKSLLGGGGVDGAIHRAAGPELLEKCRTLGGCETGAVKLTPGYHLNAKHIIHTVGPVWTGGFKNEDTLLRSCYQKSLELAYEKKYITMAFPAISTGAFGYPFDRATKIAVDTVNNFFKNHVLPETVVFVLYSKQDFDYYQDYINQNPTL